MQQTRNNLIIFIGTLLLQGCYTQFATTQRVYVSEPRDRYVQREVTVDHGQVVDSVRVDTVTTRITVHEHHYWAYESLFGFDPFYDDPDIIIQIYPRRPHYRSHWHYRYYDPFWHYSYDPWYAYDYYWSWGWYDYGYYHRPWHHPRHYHGGWHWYAGRVDGPPVKKRDWERRGAPPRYRCKTRHPEGAGFSPAVHRG